MAIPAPDRDVMRPLIFGEVLFDCFPDGSRVLGGAPFNVAWHLQGFGLAPLLLTRIGNDVDGAAVIKHMTSWGMDTRAVQHDPHFPTGVVHITLSEGQPDFRIADNQAYDHIDLTTALPAIASTNISILYHGSLAARHAGALQTLRWLREEAAIPAFVDINLRAPWWQRDTVEALLLHAQWAKLNEGELRTLRPDITEDTAAANDLIERYKIDHLIVTRGAEGAVLLQEGQYLETASTRVVNLVDTVGAGDAFSAVAILGLIRRWDAARTLRNASEFAAALCERRGAIVNDRDFYTTFTQHWED